MRVNFRKLFREHAYLRARELQRLFHIPRARWMAVCDGAYLFMSRRFHAACCFDFRYLETRLDVVRCCDFHTLDVAALHAVPCHDADSMRAASGVEHVHIREPCADESERKKNRAVFRDGCAERFSLRAILIRGARC